MKSFKPHLVFGITYHGSTVAPLRGLDNVFGKHVSSARLMEQLVWLKKRFHILTIGKLRELAAISQLPHRAAFIAFHDAYRGNYDVAFPLLKQIGVTADFFIPTDFIETERRFWVDVLDAALKYTDRTQLVLKSDQDSLVLPLGNESEKIIAALKLRRRLKSLPQAVLEGEFGRIISELGWADIGQVPRLGDHEAGLDWKQVQEMAEAGMEFGSHTHKHIICAAQGEVAVREEMAVSKRLIEDRTGRPCLFFCYPNGSYPESGNDWTDSLARRAGYQAVLYMTVPYNLVTPETYRLTGFAAGDETDFSKFRTALSPLRFRWYRWRKRKLWPWEN